MWSLFGYDRIAEHLCKFHANLVAEGGGWEGGNGVERVAKLVMCAINKSNTFNSRPVSQGVRTRSVKFWFAYAV